MIKQAIYVVSIEELSGKTIVILSLALLAKDLGRKVGYFKPIGIESVISEKQALRDEDAEAIMKILKLKEEANVICPIVIGKTEFLEGFATVNVHKYIDQVVESYKKASEGKDLMFIEGPPSLAIGSFLSSPTPKLAKILGAKILLVAKLKNDFVLDEILQAQDFCVKWGVSLFGVILNHVPLNRMEKAEKIIKPLLEKNGIKILGIIPEDKTLSALTVGEIHEVIDGKILAGKDGLDKIVQTVLVGAMTPESAMRYFQKAKNELVITGGDRSDIVFAALEVGVSALILTGNLYPSVKIFPRADDLSVPIILVPYDTYSTLRLVQGIVGRIKPQDQKRINRAKKMVKENTDWKKILEAPQNPG